MITQRDAKQRVLALWDDWPAKTGGASNPKAFFQWLSDHHPEAVSFEADGDKGLLVEFWVKTRALATVRRDRPEPRPTEEHEVVGATTPTVEPRTGEDSGHGEPHHERDLRRTTLLSAKVIYNDRQSVLSCTVRDLSSGGAKLLFAATPTCPNQILLDLGQDREHRCEVVYRTGTMIGVRFLDGEGDAGAEGAEQ